MQTSSRTGHGASAAWVCAGRKTAAPDDRGSSVHHRCIVAAEAARMGAMLRREQEVRSCAAPSRAGLAIHVFQIDFLGSKSKNQKSSGSDLREQLGGGIVITVKLESHHQVAALDAADFFKRAE